jgi:hypothetical protein
MIMKKKIILGVVGLLVLIQFFRPEKNLSDDRTKDISTKYQITPELNTLLQSACNDCHSNKTTYPLYAEILPMGWWLNRHVTEGKDELNFSSFTKLPIAVQNHKLEEIKEMVEEKEMPLPSYTWLGLHKEANLSTDQRELIINWASSQMDSLKKQYPPDSLVLKRRAPKTD